MHVNSCQRVCWEGRQARVVPRSYDATACIGVRRCQALLAGGTRACGVWPYGTYRPRICLLHLARHVQERPGPSKNKKKQPEMVREAFPLDCDSFVTRAPHDAGCQHDVSTTSARRQHDAGCQHGSAEGHTQPRDAGCQHGSAEGHTQPHDAGCQHGSAVGHTQPRDFPPFV